jgi:uncharacterized protein YecE (DUF72 family)
MLGLHSQESLSSVLTPVMQDRGKGRFTVFLGKLLGRWNQMKALGDIGIGIAGWRYEGWRGKFYPPELVQRKELEYASGRLNSIELNGSFYSFQRPESFRRWYKETPKDFIFSIKGSRFLTHIRRLQQVEIPLANFFAQGLLAFQEKLGPILWQLPPNFKCDPGRLDAFFALLPRTHKEAAALARQHDARVEGRCWFDVEKDRPLRHAIEIRNETFVCEEYITLLRKHRIASVVADTVEWPLLMDLTADFVYCRLHGSEQLYASGYDSDAIDAWAKRVVRWAQGMEAVEGRRASSRNARTARRRDVYVYFDNDAKVRAPFDAMALQKRVDELLIESAGAP